MKQLFIYLLLVCSLATTTRAQELKKFPKPLPAGDVTVNSMRSELVNGLPTVTVQINVPVTAQYQVNVFGAFPTQDKTLFAQKQPGVPARSVEYPLTVKENGWQVLACTPATGRGLSLGAGVQELVFSSTGNTFPIIDQVSITRSGTDEAFNRHTSNFLFRLNQLRQEPVTPSPISKTNEVFNKVLSNPEGSYEHAIDEAFGYSTFQLHYLPAGTTVTFETKNSTHDPVMHLFLYNNPEAASWSNDDYNGTESFLTVNITTAGYYGLLVRPYFDGVNGTTNVYQNNVLTLPNTPIGGRRFNNSMPNSGNRNFFTCRLSAGSDTRLFALTYSGGQVKGYNDDYNGTGDWNWGVSSRVKKNFTADTKVTFICSYGTGNTGTCDVYMGNPNSNAYTDWAFPNYKSDDCIQAAPSSGTYNCISWSGGVTSYWEWPLNSGSSYYVANNPLQSFDNFYKNTPKRYSGAYNYTRSGATEANAMVDLWKIPNGNYTHGSVTKPGNNHPHGYNWESKPGGLERSFHPRYALNGPGYGEVSNHYRHDGTYAPYTFILIDPGFFPKTINTDADAVKAGLDVFDVARLGDAAQAKLNELLRQTDGNTATAFEELYAKWKATWKQYATFSDPAVYTQNETFEQLYAFCLRNGEQVLPALFRLFTGATEEIAGCELLWRTTEKKYGYLMNEVKEDNRKQPNDAQGRYIIRSMYGNYVRYIEKILGRLTAAETAPAVGPVTVTVSPNPVRNQFAVSFTLAGEARVSITAMSAQTGRKIVLQNNALLPGGAHRFVADASRFAGSTGDVVSIQVTVNGITTTVKALVAQ